MLEQADKKRKPVLIASTCEVYGKSHALPFREDGDLVLGATNKGRWTYACSKAIDEFLALAYWKERKLPTVVARLFNTVGPRQTGQYGMVVPNFVRQALADQPITVFGDGKQPRCFCHVDDVVARARRPHASATTSTARSSTSAPPRKSRSGSWPSGSRALTGSASEIRTSPTRRPTRRASRTCGGGSRTSPRSSEPLGWPPTKRLDEILEDVVASQRATAAV